VTTGGLLWLRTRLPKPYEQRGNRVTTARDSRREPNLRSRRVLAIAVPALVVAAGTPVLIAAWPDDASGARAVPAMATVTDSGVLLRREASESRSVRRSPLPSRTPAPTVKPTRKPAARPTAKPKAKRTPEHAPRPSVVGYRYATTALKVRTTPSKDADARGVLSRGDRVAVTGTANGNFRQVLVDGAVRWVTADYLSRTKPGPEPAPTANARPSASASATHTSSAPPPSSGGLSSAPCPSGSSVESGLTSNAVKVHRAVCAAFPSVSSYGGVGRGGEHAAGRALDIMVSGSGLGDSIAAYVRSRASALGVSEVIWSQRIWTVQRSSEGWRSMEDRGSATANHYDHVHVTVY
jgi:hypothetical protein